MFDDTIKNIRYFARYDGKTATLKVGRTSRSQRFHSMTGKLVYSETFFETIYSPDRVSQRIEEILEKMDYFEQKSQEQMREIENDAMAWKFLLSGGKC